NVAAMQEGMSQGLKPGSYLAHSARAEARAYLRSRSSGKTSEAGAAAKPRKQEQRQNLGSRDRGETSEAGAAVKPRKQGPRQSLGRKDSFKPQEQSNGKSGVGGCDRAGSRLDWDDSIIQRDDAGDCGREEGADVSGVVVSAAEVL